MNNSIAPGSSADVNVRVTALTNNPNMPVTYKTIILKKNLVNGVNTLTQEMMSVANIKYVIKYDYVLGEDVTIPENCILEFDGGSVSAGSGQNTDTITGTNTRIKAGLVKIFNNANLAGSWNIKEVEYQWFNDIEKAINFAQNTKVYLNGNNETINIYNPIIISGSFFKIKNCIFVDTRTKNYQDNPTDYPTSSHCGFLSSCILYFSSLIYYSEIKDCTFKNSVFGIVWFTPHNSPAINNCSFDHCDCCLFCYTGCQNYHISGCTATNLCCFFASSASCFDSSNPEKNKDNYYTDGLTIGANDNKNTTLNVPSQNSTFDTWFRNNILKPNVGTYSASTNNKYFGLNAYESWKTGLTEQQISTMLANNITVSAENDLNISGHAVYIPFRNRRRCWDPVIFMDIRGSQWSNDCLLILADDIYDGKLGAYAETKNSGDFNFLMCRRFINTIIDCFSTSIYKIKAMADTSQSASILRKQNLSFVETVKGLNNNINRVDVINSTSPIRKDMFGRDTIYLSSINGNTLEKNNVLPYKQYLLYEFSEALNGQKITLYGSQPILKISFPGVIDEFGREVNTLLSKGSLNVQVVEAASIGDYTMKIKVIGNTPYLPNPIARNKVEYYEKVDNFTYICHFAKPLESDYTANQTISCLFSYILKIDYRCYGVQKGGSSNIEFYSKYNNKIAILEGSAGQNNCDQPISIVNNSLRNFLVGRYILEGFKCWDIEDKKYYYWNGTNWIDSTGATV